MRRHRTPTKAFRLPSQHAPWLSTGHDLTVLSDKRSVPLFQRLPYVKFLKRCVYLTLLIKGKPHVPLPGPRRHTTSGYPIATRSSGYTDARRNAICRDDGVDKAE